MATYCAVEVVREVKMEEEHLEDQGTDESCMFACFDGCRMTECFNGDWSAKVREQNWDVATRKPADSVC